ncbi:hypothetical protein PMAA_038490 [Paecilomyces variotii No. 5]|uniref:Uncharacterized protein n=1 Tax=Byssochlamys spectabilis (strain No. 5 / NBRC 109023) TaxID=1356009 RepID=V5I381_BYSSN|nr:hypothetical protein PMAA_038490 [Paecilomyces variotii No. 5]
MPELVLGLALSEWISARKYWPEFERYANDDDVEWSLGHTYFANMGGFIIRFSDGPEDSNPSFERPDSEENRTNPSEDETSTTNYDVEAALHQNGQESPELTIPTLENESELTDTASHPILNSLEATPGDANADMVTTSALSGQSVRTTTPQSESYSMRTKCDHRIATNIRRYEDSPHVGSKKYTKRILSWKTIFGFDWQIDRHNQKIVQHALESCSMDDLGETPVLRWYFNVRMFQGNIWYLDAPQLLLAREMGIIRSLPVLSTSQLEDQSKDSFLVRSIALVQVAWLVIEIIVRHTQGLPIAQLEVVVLAFSACSLCTYLLLWYKPQDVQKATEIMAARRPEVSDVKSLAVAAPGCFGFHRQMPFMTGSAIHSCGKMDYGFPAGLLLGATLFGGLHCLSWNSHFATTSEQTLWRISCLIVTAGPLLIILLRSTIAAALARLPHAAFAWRNIIISHLFQVCFPVYFAARLYLIVEMLYALAFSPPKTFLATDWSRYLPHLG